MAFQPSLPVEQVRQQAFQALTKDKLGETKLVSGDAERAVGAWTGTGGAAGFLQTGRLGQTHLPGGLGRHLLFQEVTTFPRDSLPPP